MLEALERQTRREEQISAFVGEALAADRAIEDGDEVYAAADVHAWLTRLARGERAVRPPARGQPGDREPAVGAGGGPGIEIVLQRAAANPLRPAAARRGHRDDCRVGISIES